MMRRRAFLQSLAAGVAGFALDPERLLWVPGQRVFFFTPPPLYPTLSISQIVAATYEKVLRERRLTDNLWFDSAFVRECERKGILIRGADLDVTLDYVRNEP